MRDDDAPRTHRSSETAPTIGILGAGKVGTVLARLARAAGYRVLISGSGSPDRIALIVEVLVPGAEPATTADVIDGADIVILALPLRSIPNLPAERLREKLVVDAMNYWEPTDGTLAEFSEDPRGTSEIVRERLAATRFVKAFSHLGYHDLDELGRPAGDEDRIALALAGDDAADLATVATLVDAFGFDPLVVDGLRNGRAFQAHTPAFGDPMARADLARVIEGARDIEPTV
ncbi:MAG: NAD(P)-binding domain-containing protein [Solirubrobacteraceae bacterium]|nr:NAD(P)-binding domain-containing protein [Solirubrobacteraceae bacterium]